jgi:hypothetical protein
MHGAGVRRVESGIRAGKPPRHVGSFPILQAAWWTMTGVARPGFER